MPNINISKSSSLVIMYCMSLPAYGGIQDTLFVEFINDECNATALPDFNDACIAAGLGGGPSLPTGAPALANLSIGSAQNNASSMLARKKQQDEQKVYDSRSGTGGNGSGDQGSWGFLVAPQYAATTRSETDFGSAFKSTLSGIVLGADYSLSNSLIIGGTYSVTKNEADFDNNVGSLDTDNTTYIAYVTWTPNYRSSIDAYIGNASSEYKNVRNFEIGTAVGAAQSSFDSTQTLIGVGGLYDWYADNWTISVGLNIDYLKTDLDSYAETQGAGFELRYPEQDIKSLLSTFGFTASNPLQRDWGLLIPNFRLATVYESKDDARLIDTTLVLSPGSVFTVETDKPDRNYFLTGFGVVSSVNGGTQWFVDYEQRFGHDYIDSWSFVVGLHQAF